MNASHVKIIKSELGWTRYRGTNPFMSNLYSQNVLQVLQLIALAVFGAVG